MLVVVLAGVARPIDAQLPEPPTPNNNGGVGHAILGGLVDGYGGLVLGTLATRFTCERGAPCSPVPATVSAVMGTAVGAYAGATDRHRAYGALIGVGVGVLGGALAYGIWSGVERLSDGREPDPFIGFGLAIAGGALGALVGTAVGGSVDGGGTLGAPAGHTVVPAPIVIPIPF